MADFETSAREFICDAPSCEVRRLVVGDDGPLGREPLGYLGTARTLGMADQNWFACKATHIRPAVEYVTTPVHGLSDADREASQWKRDLAEERNGKPQEQEQGQRNARMEADDRREAEAYEEAMTGRPAES